MIDNVVMAEDFFPVAARVLVPGGIFTWYTNEIDTLSRRHQRLIEKYFRSFQVRVPPTVPTRGLSLLVRRLRCRRESS